MSDLQEQVNALITLSTGLDAGRRVGWAKYYAAADGQVQEHDNAIRLLGRMVGTLMVGAEMLPRRSLVAAVRGVAFQVLTEPGDQDIYDQAVLKAQESAIREFAALDPATAQLVQAARDIEHRCGSCDRLLLIEKSEWLNVKCERCGRPNDIEKAELFGEED